MQNIIKHKSLSSLAILMILVIVFVMSIPKRAWAPQVQTIVARFAPLGIGPFNYVQVMMFNDFCKVAAPSVLRVFDVFDGSEIGITPLGIIEPGEGAIRTFFDLVIPHDRRNIVVKVKTECPRNEIFSGGGVPPPEFTLSLEIVDSSDDSTKLRVEPLGYAYELKNAQ